MNGSGRCLSLFLHSGPCDSRRMSRPDVYDYIGIAIIALLTALWVAHFVLPAPPPDPTRFENAPGQPLPSIRPR